MSASVNRREREYAESHSDHLLISSSGTTDTVIVHTNTDTHTGVHAHTTKLKYKNLPVRSQKAFPSPSHIRCWAHRLDLKLLGAIQYGLGVEPRLGRFWKVPFNYLLGYLLQKTIRFFLTLTRKTSAVLFLLNLNGWWRDSACSKVFAN